MSSLLKKIVFSKNPRKVALFVTFLTTEEIKINLQSLEDTQVGYISQKYNLEKYTLEKYTLGQRKGQNKLGK